MMRAIERRVALLEAQGSTTDLSHLSDAELHSRFAEICEELEQSGEAMPEGWRGALERKDYGSLLAGLKAGLCEA